MTKSTDDIAACMVEAVQHGESDALALKVGDTFLGSRGNAIERGYTVGTREYSLYSWAFLNAMPKDVWTNDGGIVTRIRKGD